VCQPGGSARIQHRLGHRQSRHGQSINGRFRASSPRLNDGDGRIAVNQRRRLRSCRPVKIPLIGVVRKP